MNPLYPLSKFGYLNISADQSWDSGKLPEFDKFLFHGAQRSGDGLIRFPAAESRESFNLGISLDARGKGMFCLIQT